MHPTEADIILFLEDRLPPEARRRVRAHLAGCAQCVETLAAVSRMEQTLAASEAPPVAPEVLRRAEELVRVERAPHGRLLRLPMPARLALATLVLAGLGLAAWLVSLRDGAPQSQFRSDAAAPVLATQAPAHRATVRPASLVFRWSGLSGAATYRVVLYHADGAWHWTGQADTTYLTVSDSLDLATGRQYLWHVEAVMPDGNTISSELRAFTVAGEILPEPP